MGGFGCKSVAVHWCLSCAVHFFRFGCFLACMIPKGPQVAMRSEQFRWVIN